MKSLLLASSALVLATAAASAADFYVVQDSASKSCMVSDTKPTGATSMAVNNGKSYATRADAEAALTAASECKTAANTAPSTMSPTTTAAPAANMAPPAARTNSTMAAATDSSMHVMTTVPANGASIKRYYDQNVYDASGAKVGEIVDALLKQDAQIDAFVVSVGGFLGMGSKDVLVPFHAVNFTMKDNKTPWLTIAATKDELKAAPGVEMDSTKTNWVAQPMR